MAASASTAKDVESSAGCQHGNTHTLHIALRRVLAGDMRGISVMNREPDAAERRQLDNAAGTSEAGTSKQQCRPSLQCNLPRTLQNKQPYT